MEKDAKSVKVKEFREILIWPFRLDVCGEVTVTTEAIAKKITTTVDHLEKSGLWNEIPDPLFHLDPDASKLPEKAYQEFVYFHPFVQRFLYGDRTKKDKSRGSGHLRVFRNMSVGAMEVALDNEVTGSFRISLTVDRLNLYLFRNGNAVLALELANGNAASGEGEEGRVTSEGNAYDMNLAHAQVVLERLRRLYPPFWTEGDHAGLSPVTVQWIGKDGNNTADLKMLPKEVATEYAHDNRRPPLAAYWAHILKPLSFDADNGLPRWSHISDERIPVMAYLAVDNPHAICPGDWVRLAMLDDAGTDRLPYGKTFMDGFEDRNCYDVFWDRGDADKSTRYLTYLMSGYGLIAVGNAADVSFTKHVREHIRRHYFQMGLIAHFQTAALLTLSDRLSQAANRMGETRFHEEVEDILESALEFTLRCWFPYVSGHFQAVELFTRWRGYLGVDTLYNRVMQDAQETKAFLDSQTERQLSEASSNLNAIATVGLVLALASGVLGMNIFIPQSIADPSAAVGQAWRWGDSPVVLAVVGACSFIAGLGITLLASQRSVAKRQHSRFIPYLGVGLLLLGGILLLVGALTTSFR